MPLNDFFVYTSIKYNALLYIALIEYVLVIPIMEK